MPVAIAPRMRPLHLRGLTLHVARVALSSSVLVLAPSTPLRAAASVALFFASFSFSHDLVHGALGLPRRLNELAIGAAALPMLISGHAMRLMHLRHHARPLADDDVEGVGARLPLLHAAALGPWNAIELRVGAFRAARGWNGRAWQIGETAAGPLLLGVIARLRPDAMWAHLLTAVAMQVTLAVWASHVPHRAPPAIRRLAARLSVLRSPVLLSLAFHDRHHREPAIPRDQLASGWNARAGDHAA